MSTSSVPPTCESRENNRGRERLDDMASMTRTNIQSRQTYFDTTSTSSKDAKNKRQLPKSLPRWNKFNV
eukprot:15355613-Ditylum_brightwellii.AAC.1